MPSPGRAARTSSVGLVAGRPARRGRRRRRPSAHDAPVEPRSSTRRRARRPRRRRVPAAPARRAAPSAAAPCDRRGRRGARGLALELRDHALGGVDGHGEADPDAAAAPSVSICELTPITRPRASSSGPPALPRVERGVGLDHVVDREAARRGDAALQRGDDAGRQRALEPERVADRERRVADATVGGVAELERRAGRGPWGRRAAARGRCRRPCRPARADGVLVGERHLDRRSRRRRRGRW